MIPSILARQLEKGLSDYIETTFPMTNAPFMGSLASMLGVAGEGTGSVFREPYLSVKLPFQQVEVKDCPVHFETILLKYPPYLHQVKAWQRLIGAEPLSTLIATGTGSGKTECFSYPILEYCWQHRQERGIKALIIYPMNALATDQAKRLAEQIYASSEMRGEVTAGMYVGGVDGEQHKEMGADFIITDKETMLSNPPDILLTNYKMLDYLLVRPKDAQLWSDNKPETLRFIAVDELHTFDGAQGTDLACLLRRLKSRLQVPAGHICCIGTSATMGAKDSAGKIREYANQVFGMDFGSESVITEARVCADEFFAEKDQTEFQVPTAEQLDELDRLTEADAEEQYLSLAAKAFMAQPPDNIMSDGGRIKLAESLIHHRLLQMVISRMTGKYWQATRLIYELQPTRSFPELTRVPHLERMIYALTALVSHARIVNEQKELRAFLTVNVQLWLRELRRLLAKVTDEKVVYATASDLNDQKRRQYLPVVNCRDCGATAWVTRLGPRMEAEVHDLPVFYNRYFHGDAGITMVYPRVEDGVDKPYQSVETYFCTNCMQVVQGNDEQEGYCASCGKKMIPVYLVRPANHGHEGQQQYECPCCGSKRGLALMGLRSATEISTMISQLMASRFNDDKKTLAFSDSVQDAAHRAGFFNSRTWRFGLRGSVQQYVKNGGDGQSLTDFCTGFIQYYHEKLSDEEFISRFVAPNMIWMRAYERMKEQRKLGHDKDAKELMYYIEQRLKYEIMLEYGLTGRLGRTLEKSGCSVLAFHSEDIDHIAEIVQMRMINEQGQFMQAPVEAFQQMVVGFLNRMRMNGAFDDPIFHEFVANYGKSFMLSNKRYRWLPGIQAGRALPHHVVETKSKSGSVGYSYDSIVSMKYTRWVDFCYYEVGESEQCAEYVNRYILEEAVKIGLIKVLERSPEDCLVYGLNKDRVYITSQVRQMRCAACGTVQPVPLDNLDYWQEAPCSRQKCGGHILEDAKAGLNYYGVLYNQGDIIRVHAREHTGLLSRSAHEELEEDFKRKAQHDRKPWDPNVLSCTPTLEMGIDIGDLSTVILCSMPPTQSQFLQRTGRAGRKDGNALALAVAGARPHDLYYYADPLEMMEGNVEPPRVFLNASAVLERQFVAFCMDTWVYQGIPESAIPPNVRTIVNKFDRHPNDVFPFNFLTFVQDRLEKLLDSFLMMFGHDVTAVTQKELRVFAKGENADSIPMHRQVLHAFQELQEQGQALQENIKQIRILRRKLEKGPADSSFEEEIKVLKSEEKALVNVLREMMRKDVFNFLSDEGILPNYAFPEAGIMLKAVLIRRETSEEAASSGKRKYEKMVYDYNRSASSALSEFAPLNTFYAGGRKLTIDQIDITTAEPYRWRFCPNCNHADRDTPAHGTVCPHCLDPGWGDAGQVRSMLEVKMVYSNADYEASLISDESDERANIFYCKELFVDVDDKDIDSAYRMDNESFNFGYEFVKKAKLREINFGESDSTDNQEGMLVAGRGEVRRGFRICRKCGKIQTMSTDKKGNISKDKPKHTAYCPERNNHAALNSDVYEDCLFLYRQFETEILRLLVPATTMDDTKVKKESFVAAFMLGMKEYFGNVDHLRASVMEEPVPDADYRKQYLVIYDSVPGGTGYLKQLMTEKNALVKIFERALSVLEHCVCKDDPQRDGCYHCLYGYRQSRELGNISRRAAIRLLKSILSGKDHVERIKKLSDVPVNSLFDSELEQQFVAAFDELNKSGKSIQCVPDMVNGKEGYRLLVNERTWEIEPQVNLGPQDGVKVNCKPDFILRPIRQEDNPLPVAVFTDGLQYHHNIMADDTLKREAIRRSGRFRVWSLSWDDVQTVFNKSDKEYATAVFRGDDMPLPDDKFRLLMKQLKQQQPENIGLVNPEKQAPFELLVSYLANPNADQLFRTRAEEYAWRLLDITKQNRKMEFMHWQEKIAQAESLTNFAEVEFEFGKTMFGSWTPLQDRPCLRLYAGLAMQSAGREPPVVMAVLSDVNDVNGTRIYSREWNAFWHFWNVMQFLPHFIGVSEMGLAGDEYLKLPGSIAASTGSFVAKIETDSTELIGNMDPTWQEAMELFLTDEEKEAAAVMIANDIPAPENVGADVLGMDGSIAASPVMAWPIYKIAFCTEDMEDDIAALRALDWQVFTRGEDLRMEMFN